MVGSNAQLSASTNVLISDVGKLDLYTAGNQTIGSLAGAGDVVLNNKTLSVGSNDSDTRFNGVLNTGSSGKLIKEGTGTFALGGAAANNTHSIVEIAAGTLLLDKHSGDSTRLAVGTSANVTALTIADGATVSLGGSHSLDANDALSQINLTSNIQIDSGGILDLNGRRLTVNEIIGAGAIVNNGTQAAVLELGRSSASFTLGTSITAGSNGHGVELIKTGTGTLTLDTTVSYAGIDQVTIDNGILTQNGANTLSATTDVVILSGEILDLGDHDLAIGGLSGAGNVDLGAGTLTVGSGSDYELSGVISGTGDLIKTGSGQLILGNNQTYTGATTVSAGELRFGDGNSRLLPTTSGITVDTGATVAFESSRTVTMEKTDFITGDGSFIKDGTGQLTLNGANNFSGGSTLIDGTIVLGGFDDTSGSDITGLGTGTIKVAGEATLTTASGVEPTLPNSFVIEPDATLHLKARNTNSTITLAGGITGAGDLTLDTRADTAIILASDVNIGGEVTIRADSTFKTSLQVGNGGTTGSLLAARIYADRYGALVYDHASGHTAELAVAYEGKGHFLKNGAGELELKQPLQQSSLGNTYINDGTLTLMGENLLSRESDLIINGNGTLNLNGFNQTTVSIENGGNSFRDGVPDNGGGHIDTGAGGVLKLLAGSGTFSGVISGLGGLTKDGTGRLTLTGASTYTGPTQVLAGYLRFGADNNGTIVDALSDQTAVYVADGATLEVTPAAQSVGSIAGEGVINLYGYTLTVGTDDQNSVFSGEIIHSSGSLIKTGAGTLELAGANTVQIPTAAPPPFKAVN